MEVFHPRNNRRAIEDWVSSREGEIYFFTPFLTEKGLGIVSRDLRPHLKVNLLVRASFDDFISGVLSVKGLRDAIEMGWHIRRCSHLHAKVFFDNKELLFGSVNITGRGLSYPPNGNLEILAKSKFEDNGLLDELILTWRRASEVDGEYLNLIIKEVEQFKHEYDNRKKLVDDINSSFYKGREFTLGDIVQSTSIKSFYNNLNSGIASDPVFLHDYNLLSACKGIDYEELLDNFLETSLAKKFLNHVGDGRFFGELRRWLSDNVDDVPTPSREDYNNQLNKLYDLVIETTRGAYRRVTPGARSEKLERIRGQ